MSSIPASTPSNTPVKILVSLDDFGGIQVLDDEVLDLIAGGFISIDLATEVSRLPASDTHPVLPSGLTRAFAFLGVYPVTSV
jgi:hypothetical protein